MSLVTDVLSWILLSVGGVFVFIGGIGVVRMPDFYTRLHASSLTDSLGTLAVLVGLMLQFGLTLASLKLLTIAVFLFLTAPTAVYALANAALQAGVESRAGVSEKRE